MVNRDQKTGDGIEEKGERRKAKGIRLISSIGLIGWIGLNALYPYSQKPIEPIKQIKPT